MSKAKTRPPKPEPGSARYFCEAEIVTGLKDLAAAELHQQPGVIHLLEKNKPEEQPFEFNGNLAALSQLHQSLAVYLVQHYAIPRPQALLGHQHFTQLIRLINSIRSMHPAGTFKTFRISAAGSESRVFQRIRQEIITATGLQYNHDEAHLLLRIRKADIHRDGWEVLLRLTPRPLSARAWRVSNMEGALNATIASAMIELTAPKADDRVFNLMCGSATLLIERLRRAPAAVCGGCDTDPAALRSAMQNIEAAGFSDAADVLPMDATQLDLPDACIDMLCADLPWGQLVGSHEDNVTLYPQVLAEAARITVPGGRAVFITHEIRLMETILQQQSHLWRIQHERMVFQGGLHPRIYLLQRC